MKLNKIILGGGGGWQLKSRQLLSIAPKLAKNHVIKDYMTFFKLNQITAGLTLQKSSMHTAQRRLQNIAF